MRLAVLLLAACVDHDVVQRPPCNARVYSYDATVGLDGCIVLPAQCYDFEFDDDLSMPGVQFRCTVSGAEGDLARCNDPARAPDAPCWQQTADSACGESGARIEVAPPDVTAASAYCLGCLADWYRGDR